MKKSSHHTELAPKQVRSRQKYHYHDLKIGESFVGTRQAYRCANEHGRRNGKRFSCRVQSDGLYKIVRSS